MAEQLETVISALARLAKACDRPGCVDFVKLVDDVVAMRELYRDMCTRLQNVTQELHLGLGGEHVDVIVVDELRLAVDECKRLRALLAAQMPLMTSIDFAGATIEDLEARLKTTWTSVTVEPPPNVVLLS